MSNERRTKYGDLSFGVMVYQPDPGVDISHAIAETLALVNLDGCVIVLKHNYGMMLVSRASSFDSLMAEFNRSAR